MCKVKVLFVHKGILGHPGTAALDYYTAFLANQGYEVSVVAKSGGDASLVTNAGVYTIEVSKDSEWLATLWRVSRSLQPDIVHVFNIHNGCGLYPYLMRARSDSSFILDIRSPLLRSGIIKIFARLKNKFEVIGYNAIAAHGEESAQTVVGRGKYIHWLPPGIDLEAIPVRRKDSLDHTPLLLIYTGSLRRIRNIPRMILAVLEAAQEVSITLDIYGDGEDKEFIEEIVRQSKYPLAVRMMGVIPRGELFKRLGDYDIALSYVPKAIYDPALPLKTLEYLAGGLPTIATFTTGHTLIIRNGENGLLVDEDPGIFAKGIINIARDERLRSQLASNARASVEVYDWRYLVRERLIPLYQKLLEKRQVNGKN